MVVGKPQSLSIHHIYKARTIKSLRKAFNIGRLLTEEAYTYQGTSGKFMITRIANMISRPSNTILRLLCR